MKTKLFLFFIVGISGAWLSCAEQGGGIEPIDPDDDTIALQPCNFDNIDITGVVEEFIDYETVIMHGKNYGRLIDCVFLWHYDPDNEDLVSPELLVPWKYRAPGARLYICNFPDVLNDAPDSTAIILSGTVYHYNVGAKPPEYEYYLMELSSIKLKEKEE